jgi:hypothetical protein
VAESEEARFTDFMTPFEEKMVKKKVILIPFQILWKKRRESGQVNSGK